MKITIDICTRERYNVLCDCLLAILNQTYLSIIDEIIIFDDTPENKRLDLRKFNIYNYVFHEFEKRNITWMVKFGNGKGQVIGHQFIKDTARNDWIWRLDDDHVPQNNVLEGLYNTIKDEKTIVSCLIPYFFSSVKFDYCSECNTIDNLNYNSQWVIDWAIDKNNRIDICEHLYSSFIYNRKHTIDYCLDLSPVSHREETIFTYRNFRHGCELRVNRNYIIWHKHFMSGGIRSKEINDKKNFEHDEQVANRIINNLKKWNGEKIIPINGGIGDNYAFRSSFDNDIENLKKKYGKDVKIATANKDVYKDMNVEFISIQAAIDILGIKNVEKYNVYRFMSENYWKESIVKAYKKMLGV